MKIGIIADDLTSAADAALPFFNKGLSSRVVRNYYEYGDRDQVLSVDSNSRSLPEAQAAEVTKNFSEILSSRDILIKTIDSTLRGHIKSEIKAAFLASGRKKIIIAPAFAENGRTTKNGLQFVNNILVSESIYKNDPVHPSKTSRVSDLVDPVLGRYVVLESNSSYKDVINALEDFDIIIIDSSTQESLNKTISFVPNSKDILWVGSPGIASALANKFGNVSKLSIGTYSKNKVLVVVGSANNISRQQKKELLHPDICLDISLDDLNEFPDVAVISSPSNNVDCPDALLNKISSQAAECFIQGKYGALIATGGETANAILENLDVDSFLLVDEIEPGFPVGVANSPACEYPITIGIKAGGFGTVNSLYKAVKKIKL